jgi:diacylglycerol O-acyltransferase
MNTLPLDPVDAAWFHMDGSANTAVVTALLTARHVFDFDATRRVFADRLAPIARFRCRVVERGLAYDSPCWQEMPDFDIDQHVHHRALPAGADEAALLALVSDLASQPLPPTLPLWQVHVVDGPGVRGALVMRYHHCIGDGAAMVDVARRVFDSRDGGLAATAAAARQRHGQDSQPGALAMTLLRAARSSFDAAGAIARDLLKSPDPISPFKGHFVARQRVARSSAIPLDRLRAIAAAFDAKINDVVVAAVAGALRAYLLENGQPVDELKVRAMMPVNLRPAERAHDVDNEFGLAILALPVELEDAPARLRETRIRIDAVKRSSEAIGLRWLLDAFGRGPRPVQQLAQWVLGSKASLVLTNVAGPANPLMLGGRTIDRMMFWVPHPGEELGMGLSAFSYRGRLSLGVIGDAVRLRDPQRIARLFEREVAALMRQVDAAAASPTTARAPRRRPAQPG